MARINRDRLDDDQMNRQFRAFYGEVSKAQMRALEMRETDADSAAQSVSKHLEGLIELQTLESKRDGNRFELESVADARYLKAALADEILLNSDWIGRSRWTEHLLEASLFRTSIAGEKVFTRIEQVLSSREPSLRPLASLYLSALALGFQGKYRGVQDAPKFAGYRQELFQFIYQKRADLSGRDRVLSPQAYGSTLSHIEARKMPSLSRWSVVVLMAFVALLALSEILWLWQSWPVRQVLDTGSTTRGASSP
jgi:type VI secretion system protein ImpK